MLYLMVGIPASGKSTIAKELAEKYNFKVVSRDEIRFSILREHNVLDNEHYFDYEKETIKQYYKTIEKELNAGNDVIADATHLTPKARKPLVDRFAKFGISAIYIPILPKTAMYRNSQRQGYKQVPNEVIKDMNKRIIVPSRTEGFSNVFIKGIDRKLEE